MHQSNPSPPQSPARGVSAPISLWGRLRTHLNSWFEVPEGYQDETGFHYGIQPKPAQFSPPTMAASRGVFTDRACDAIVYASAKSPKPAEAPSAQRHEQTQPA